MRRIGRVSLALAAAMALLSQPVGAESPLNDPAHNTPEGADDWLDDDEIDVDPEMRDPWEPTNRVFFGMNQFMDTVFFAPLTDGYQFLVPEPARRGVHRVFRNLNSPSVIVNDLLQLRLRDAATTTGRFVVNTVFGFGGVFDAAKEAGWEAHSADFGQTLAIAGMPSGPYVMVPIFGPNTVRDGVGDMVDRMFQPLTYLVGPTPVMMFGAGQGLSIRDQNDEALEALEESSVDFYAVLRSAYYQNRRAEIWNRSQRDDPDEPPLAALDTE